MRQGVKTLQVRAGTVSRGHTHKGKVSGSHEAGGESREREAERPPFFAFRAQDALRTPSDPALNRTTRPQYGCRRLSRLQFRSLLPERFELARGTRRLRHSVGCDLCLDLDQICEPYLSAGGLSLHGNLRLFVYDGVGLTIGQGRSHRTAAAAAKRGVGVPILSWAGAPAKATAKLGAPRILDAGPARSSRWQGVDERAFSTVVGKGSCADGCALLHRRWEPHGPSGWSWADTDDRGDEAPARRAGAGRDHHSSTRMIVRTRVVWEGSAGSSEPAVKSAL